jgi:hypothetical protein
MHWRGIEPQSAVANGCPDYPPMSWWVYHTQPVLSIALFEPHLVRREVSQFRGVVYLLTQILVFKSNLPTSRREPGTQIGRKKLKGRIQLCWWGIEPQSAEAKI